MGTNTHPVPFTINRQAQNTCHTLQTNLTNEHKVIMTNEHLLVNQEVSNEQDQDISIERCPHDRENPYTMVHNALIRDKTLAPDVCWLIIFLLSNSAGWKINIQQVINHLKGRVGRDRVYQMINEAIEAGYMKREVTKKGNLHQQTRYFVSETAKFKKILRRPDFQDPEIQDTENPHIKNNSSKKELSKELTTPPIPPQCEAPESEEIANAMAANAAEMELASAKKKVEEAKPKRTRTPSDFGPKVREVGQTLVNSLVRTKPDYVPPKNLSAFLTEVDFLLRLDKRDAQKVYDVFNWALSDSFWADKMFKPNPAKYLREKFDQLEMKMNAKPAITKAPRKFAPSSNHEKAMAAMEEMNKRAL